MLLCSDKDEWWSRKASEAQEAGDRKDAKTFYSFIHEVFGPTQSNVAPLRSKDGSELCKNVKSIQGRWLEHYSELLNRPSTFDASFIDNVEQLPIIDRMANSPPNLFLC